jgi:hypothetical protein
MFFKLCFNNFLLKRILFPVSTSVWVQSRGMKSEYLITFGTALLELIHTLPLGKINRWRRFVPSPIPFEYSGANRADGRQCDCGVVLSTFCSRAWWLAFNWDWPIGPVSKCTPKSRSRREGLRKGLQVEFTRSRVYWQKYEFRRGTRQSSPSTTRHHGRNARHGWYG